MTVAEIAQELYNERPTTPLFHYTSLDGLLGMSGPAGSMPTDLHFLTDAAEMNRTAQTSSKALRLARRVRDDFTLRLRQQLIAWSRGRLTLGHAVFAACFTAHGDLLSQWRSYCEPTKGVSVRICCRKSSQQKPLHKALGLDDAFMNAARQQQLAAEMLRSVEDVARAMGETRTVLNDTRQLFPRVFDSIEDDLLLIAALLKEPAFAEEQEWRAVSPIVTNYVAAPIAYRVGISMLIPYIEFLASVCSRSYAGFSSGFRRTNPSHQQFNGVGNTVFNEGESESPPGVSYCLIPYRTW